MKHKQNGGMSITKVKSSIYDASLGQKVEVILTSDPTNVHQIAVQV